MNVAIDLGNRMTFTARPDTVGTSVEEIAAMVRGEIPPERIEKIRATLRGAASWLHIHDCAGRA